MLWIDFSDILDGLAARKWARPTGFGAALDAGVDFVVLNALYVFYVTLGIYPLWLLVLMGLSFGFFSLNGILQKALAKSRFGKYSGAVLFFGLTLSVAARAFFPAYHAVADGSAVFLSMLILTVSVVENTVHLYRRSRR